jgi:hypothetical protein
VNRFAFAALGTLPLAFFLAYLAVAFQRGRAADSLWLCHVANLLLAIGMFARSPRLVGIAFSWIVLGLPLWAFDAWRNGDVSLVSGMSHLGGFAVGLYALWRLRLSWNPWLAAVLLFVALRLLCRWLTPAALDVNLAHADWTYWLATTAAAGAALWAIGRMLTSWFKREAS